MTKKEYKEIQDFVGKEGFYLTFKSIIKKIKKVDNMYLAYFDNGMVINFSIIKNKEGKYLEDLIQKIGGDNDGI